MEFYGLLTSVQSSSYQKIWNISYIENDSKLDSKVWNLDNKMDIRMTCDEDKGWIKL